MKKAVFALKLMIALVTIAFIAMSVWHYFDYKNDPRKYAAESAPWYTSVLIWGVIAALLVIACIVALAILHKKNN